MGERPSREEYQDTQAGGNRNRTRGGRFSGVRSAHGWKAIGNSANRIGGIRDRRAWADLVLETAHPHWVSRKIPSVPVNISRRYISFDLEDQPLRRAGNPRKIHILHSRSKSCGLRSIPCRYCRCPGRLKPGWQTIPKTATGMTKARPGAFLEWTARNGSKTHL